MKKKRVAALCLFDGLTSEQQAIPGLLQTQSIGTTRFDERRIIPHTNRLVQVVQMNLIALDKLFCKSVAGLEFERSDSQRLLSWL